MSIPRSEHPKPQFCRENWLNLNGTWQFEIDHGNSGEARGLHLPDAVYSRTITVPFCPESKLSGVAYTDFMAAVWYKRNIVITKEQLTGRVVMHFGAVDYQCTLFVNGKQVGTHKGGYSSFSFDITGFVKEGENTLTVRAVDDTRSSLIPSGKQSERYQGYACLYTRSTGIWQTVWLEFTPITYIRSIQYRPQPQDGSVTITVDLAGCASLCLDITYQGKPMGKAEREKAQGLLTVTIPLNETHLWEVGKGRLYDVTATYGEDVVTGYFGLRCVSMSGMKFLLNGKSVFQRLVLDQGYYPDGIYTAPTDKDLEDDVLRSIAMGFNGARLHQKIFEERFLYYCDKHGYMVWGEYPSWGVKTGDPALLHAFLPEWMETVQRDFNHPSIIGWCPFNETHPDQFRETIRMAYRVTKALDPTRPCIDTSGHAHVETDIFDLHDYDQNPVTFTARYADFAAGGQFAQPDYFVNMQTYGGQPVFISEYGGIRWTDDQKGWGYGDSPKTRDEFMERFRKLAEAQLNNPNFFGLCYTQLTDVEIEQNGLYTYDRVAKFPPEEIAAILTQKAAIED